jgi:hypothetical protein
MHLFTFTTLLNFAPWRAIRADEVRRALRSDSASDPRSAAIHAAAAQTGAWCALLSERAARELGPAARRLPSVIYWYQHGLSPEAIGRRLTPLGAAWDGERAVDAACRLIARVANKRADWRSARQGATGRRPA